MRRTDRISGDQIAGYGSNRFGRATTDVRGPADHLDSDNWVSLSVAVRPTRRILTGVNAKQPSNKLSAVALVSIVATYCCISTIGITWGLPTSHEESFLFAQTPKPSGKQIIEQTGLATRSQMDMGADVDATPIEPSMSPTTLTDSTEDIAQIYRRYRLFSHQPDEMITFMALSGMNPRALKLDPKLYQYGGLFIYPIGGLIAAGSTVGITTLSGDPVYYLDHPESFGRFYIVARLYSAAWGVLGILIVFRIGRLLADTWTGVVAAGLFALLPVVVCMSHEATPYLGGAVLMLAAVMFAMQSLQWQRSRDWAGLFVCCGAAVGIVVSSWPIVILVPLVVGMHCLQQHRRQVNERTACRQLVNYRPIFVRATIGGTMAVGATYLALNPYIVINAFTNRQVLANNPGNSLDMYAIDRLAQGAIRMTQLTIEGATLPLIVLGVAVWIVTMGRRSWIAPVLWAPTVLFIMQFVFIGAGKPDEYGRFGIFPAAALAIGGSVAIIQAKRRSRIAGVALLVLVMGWCGLRSAGYLHGFHVDANHRGSRTIAADHLHQTLEVSAAPAIAVIAEPAPYSCPPLEFGETRIEMYRSSPNQRVIDRASMWLSNYGLGKRDVPAILVAAVDDPVRFLNRLNIPDSAKATVCEAPRPRWLFRGKISWANKPIVIIESPAR